MPQIGDSFTVEIKQAHIEWGTHRHSPTRNTILGEGYIQIPARYARQFQIYNSNNLSTSPVYTCSSVDGHLQNENLLASGNSQRGDILAKQFQGHGSLQTIGEWYDVVGARVGDLVRVDFTGPNDMTIELIRNNQTSIFDI